MGHSNTPHVKAYTRKIYGRTVGIPIRTLGTRRKGFPTIKRNASASVNNNNKNSRRVKVLVNETRKRKESKQKVELWVRVFEEINELSENTGLEIDEDGNLISNDGEEISLLQYNQLIEELQGGLDSAEGDEKEVFEKAIRFIKREKRKARKQAGEMNV